MAQIKNCIGVFQYMRQKQAQEWRVNNNTEKITDSELRETMG